MEAHYGPVYHGTPHQFKEFKHGMGKGGFGSSPDTLGFFFTDDEGHASEFGENIKTVYLNLNSPLILEADKIAKGQQPQPWNIPKDKLTGYDGIIVKKYTNPQEIPDDAPYISDFDSNMYIVFDNKNINTKPITESQS